MKRASTVMAVTLGLVAGLATSASADGATSASSSYGIETVIGIEADGVWYSTFALAYDVNENGNAYDVIAPTLFVDGLDLTLECNAYTQNADVDVDPNLADGAFAGTAEGSCFDYNTFESFAFTISLDVVAVGTGRGTVRGGSYTEDGARCVSQRSARDGLTIGTVRIQIPDRGIDIEADGVDEYASLVGFTSRCYPANGPKGGGDHH